MKKIFLLCLLVSGHCCLKGQNPPTYLIADQAACFGEMIEVPIRVSDFINMASFQYSVRWEPGVIEFLELSSIHPILEASTIINTDSTGRGGFGISWIDLTSSGTNLAANEILFTLEFQVVGLGGIVSPISFGNVPTLKESIRKTGSTFEPVMANFAAGNLTIDGPGLNNTLIESVTDAGNNGAIDITVSNGTAPFDFLWNTGAITEDISGLSVGDYAVTITDQMDCKGIFNFMVDLQTATSAEEVTTRISIAPNPVSDYFRVDFQRLATGVYQFFDSQGIRVSNGVFKNTDQQLIKVEMYPPGIYWLSIRVERRHAFSTGDQTYFFKILKL